MAFSQDADEEVRVCFIVSARGGKSGGLRIPDGYYGNSFAAPVAISTTNELRANPVGHAVDLVRKAKAEVDAEYIQSVADHMALRGRPNIAATRAYVVSDLTRVRFGDLDYGWGRPVYGGAVTVGPIPGCSNFLVRGRNADDGEDDIVVPMWLPGPAMDRFKEEMGKLLRPPVPRQHQRGVFPPQRSGL